MILVRAQVGWSAERRAYTAAALLVVVVAFAARAHAFLLSSIHWDEGVYIITAQRWILGGLPYLEVWDQHPPGLPALLVVAQLLIPDPVLGARLAATLAAMVTALLLHRFAARYLNRPGAGLVAALLYIFCISRWAGLVANTEVFNNACVTSAAYLLYGAVSRPRNSMLRALTAAIVLGVGLQIKYVVLPEAVILCGVFVTARYYHKRDLLDLTLAAGLLVLMGCLPTGIVILYFWLHGALQPFLAANVGANLAYLGVVPTAAEIARSTANGLAPLTGSLVVIGYVLTRCVRWRWRLVATLTPQVWILLWIIATVINVSLPLKFSNHYYFALYPPVCLAAALALSVAALNRAKGFLAGLVLLFITAVSPWALGEARAVRSAEADAPRMVADFITRSGLENPSLFVYDYDPVVYALARLRPPTRYVLGSELVEFSYSARVDGVAEVQRVLDAWPDFIVLHQRLPGIFVPVAMDNVVARRLEDYHLVFQIQNGVDDAMVSIYRK